MIQMEFQEPHEPLFNQGVANLKVAYSLPPFNQQGNASLQRTQSLVALCQE